MLERSRNCGKNRSPRTGETRIYCCTSPCTINPYLSQIGRYKSACNIALLLLFNSENKLASQPACRKTRLRYGCRAPKITQTNRLLRRIYESVVPKIIFLLRHGDSFVLPYITFFSIDWNA